MNIVIPIPHDRMVWIVTDEGEVHEVRFNDEHKLWLGKDAWSRQDGESGTWESAEILGWSDSRADAEEAAKQWLDAFPEDAARAAERGVGL